MITPPKLKKGDLIAILASASGVHQEPILKAKKIIENRGFVVSLGKYLIKQDCYFAGTPKERAAELQKNLDNPKVKAILFARGGYGSVQIIDRLSFKKFKKKPKWLVGFSDITLFHLHLFSRVKVRSIHGPMPNHFDSTPKKNLNQLFEILTKNKKQIHRIKSKHPNKTGQGKGKIVGGNLSLLVSVVGSKSMPNLKNKILFIEEISEYKYAIDRMLQTLKRSGVFSELSGVIVGAFSETKDTKPSYGKTVENIILDTFKDYSFPVLFGFSCGHIQANNPFVHGGFSHLNVYKKSGLLTVSC